MMKKLLLTLGLWLGLTTSILAQAVPTGSILLQTRAPGSGGLSVNDISSYVISQLAGGIFSPLTFNGPDGTPQFSIGATLNAAEYYQAIGGIAGAGGSFICRNAAQTGNVACNITAQGNANVNFANSGSGQLASAVDPGAPVSSGGQVQLTPSTSSGPTKVGNATYGVNLDCGSGEVCNAGGQPIATFGSVYALNVNGDFQIDQLNEGASIVGGNARVTDGWFSVTTLGAKFTIQRSTTVFPTNAGTYYYSSASVTNSTASTPAATDQLQLVTKLTGQEAAQLRFGSAQAKAITLDVCIEGDASLTYPASIPVFLNNNAGGGIYRSFVHLVSLSAASVWSCASIPVPGDTTGTYQTQTSVSTAIIAGVTLGCGSNFQTTTLDAWYTAGTSQGLCTSSSTNLVTIASGHINVTGFHIRLGTQNYLASPFQSMPYALEYTRARQRYWKTFAVGTKPAQNVGAASGELQFPATILTTGTQRAQTVWLPNMIAAPSAVTFFNPSGANANCRDETAAGDGGAGTSSNATAQGFNVTCTGNASTALNNLIGVHMTVDTNL